MANKHVKSFDPVDTRYTIYTDGGCMINPGGPGGYGVVILDKDTGEITQFSGGFESTTNNRMEIMAAIVALEHIPEGSSANLFSDSEYMINCFSGVWSRNKNTDLFARLDAAAKGKTVKLSWVKGHAGNVLNETCDTLATKAMTSGMLQEDSGYIGQKKKGREFFEIIDHYSEGKTPGAMGVTIEIPEELHSGVEFLSAREYSEKYKVHRTCASAILQFGMESKPAFKSYIRLKTDGIDSWSRSKLPTLQDGISLPDNVLAVIQKYLPNEKDTLSAFRWYRRGLPLADSIRKVLVDREVSANAMQSHFS